MFRQLYTHGYRAQRIERYLRHKGRQLFNILTPWMWPARRRDRETRMINEAVFEKLASRDPAMIKEAVDAVNDFTRKRMREDGFLRQVLPQVPISNDELDRVGWADKPVKVPDSPGAISIPFGKIPENLYIQGTGRIRRHGVSPPRKTLPIVLSMGGTLVDTLPLPGYIRGVNPHVCSPEASPRALSKAEEELLRAIRGEPDTTDGTKAKPN